MEFVLVTTYSSSSSSGGSSVMKFGDYREDDQNAPEQLKLPLEEEFLQFGSDSDDEDKALLEGFNALSARNRLICYDHCIKVVLDQDLQKGLELEVGIHISEENPWKQIRKQMLLDYLPDGENVQPEISELRLKLSELSDDSLVLVGFAAAITDVDDTDTYLFYADPETAKESVSLVQRLEAFDRQKVNKTIFKYPRPWKSLGSEVEVDLQVEVKRTDRMEVEVQRLYVSNKAPEPFSFRFAEDVRDGYVELVPKSKNMNVVTRKRVSVAVQSAAQRVETEQQTIPTFPANAWSQYWYELPIDPNQPVETVEDNATTDINESCGEDDDESSKEKEIDFIGPSDAMKELMKFLEFNAIDMYRDDYNLIAKTAVRQYTKPVIKESFCFIDHERCSDRFVNAFAWHPTQSGIFVASYTYKTLNTFLQDEKATSEEVAKKSNMLPNPILLWSFNDTLYPKLVLETPREVTCLSFCPYDPNVLIGGLITGQLIIWDLKNCLYRVEHPEDLTDKQVRNRERLHSFMSWSKFVETSKQNIIHPVVISHYELSQKKYITSIKWLNRRHSVASSGLIQESVKPNEFYRHFVTASLDGTVAFWDLDFVSTDVNPAEVKRSDTKRKFSIRPTPEQLVSPYEKLNGIFRPVYVATCEQPISSLIFDEGLFRYEPMSDVADTQIDTRIEFKVKHEQQEKASNRLLISSLLGSISTFIWEGFLYKDGKLEKAKQIETFATIHNGPISLVERNPFMSGVILSVGENIFAIWHESNQSAPILWRRRETQITCAQWSPTRMSLFFVACYDGVIEVWDLLTRTDQACISHDSGAKIITIITQHKLSLPTDILMIGDHKANLRAFVLPSTLSQPNDGDHDKFKKFIESELSRKENFSMWQEMYIEKNKDLDEAKQFLNREESRRTLESPTPQHVEKDVKMKDEKKRSSTGARSKAVVKQVKPKLSNDYTERMRRKWEEKRKKRLIKAIIELKRFDPEQIERDTKPERDRIAYNKEKKRAFEVNFRRMNEELNEMRARLIPPKDPDLEADRLDYISKNVDNMQSADMDGFQYEVIKTAMEEELSKSKCDAVDIQYHELLQRAQANRSKMNRAIYEKKRKAYVEKSVQINDEPTE